MYFQNYKARVLNIDRANLIQYLPLDEHAGAIANDSSPENNDGAYVNCTLNNLVGPDGRGAVSADGVNDLVNLYSVGLNGDWNGGLYTVLIWLKISNWTQVGEYFATIGADSNNRFVLNINGAGDLQVHSVGGGAAVNLTYTENRTSWISVVFYNNKAGNETKLYINGVEEDSDVAGGVYAGALGNTICVLMAKNTGDPSIEGKIAHFALWKSILSDAQIKNISRI